MVGLCGAKMELYREYSFNERMAFSEGVSRNSSIENILLSAIPGAVKIIRADKANDLNGVDFWVILDSGKKVGVDVKARSVDYAKRYGKDDLALEFWSVRGKKIGWTLDETKITDYIFWIWKDTGRWCLIPFLMLLKIFKENHVEWIKDPNFEIAEQHSNKFGKKWISDCIYVRRKLIWRKMYEKFGGELI